jgi:hypothetical protein
MNVLVSGCSFTQWPEYPGGPNICWPKFLQDLNPDWDIKNIAEPAAGNQYIADSVIRSTMSHRPDLVLVMWSGVSRLDYLTSLEDPAWERLFDSYGFYRRIDECPSQLGYIFSGGQMGTWYKNDVAHKMFYEMYKVSSPLSLATINLMEIVKLQNYLQNKKIPYRFMSYVNYWNTDANVSPNGDFGVLQFPELKSLINEIDFDSWIFSNNKKDGVYELAKQKQDFQPDGFHPGIPVYQQWAQLVNDHLHT